MADDWQPVDDWVSVGKAGPQPTIGDRIVGSPVGRFVHDAILDPIINTGALLAKIDPTGGAARAAPQLMEKPYQASIAANRNTPGYAAERAKADAIATAGERKSGFTDQVFAPYLSSMAGTAGLISGQSLDASNAAADAAIAGIQDYQAKNPGKAFVAQTIGGLSAVPEGAAGLPAVAPKQPVPTIPELRKAAKDAYKAVDDSGLAVSGSAYDQMATDLKAKLDKLGIDPDLHPDATAALNRIAALKTQAGKSSTPISFQNVTMLRELAGDAAGAQLPRDAMRGSVIQDHIDDFVDKLTPADISGGTDPAATISSLNNARDLYSRAKQAETIQGVINKADIKSAAYSQSGGENALRAQFRQLALNDKKMNRLSPQVRDAVKRVAKGAPVANVLRAVGKYAPHGPMSTALGASLGGGAGALVGGLFGAEAGGGIGAVALPALGELARAGATRMTEAAAQRALDTAALGKTALPKVHQPAFQLPRASARTPLPKLSLVGLIGSSLAQHLQRQ